jgi:hypothetical protein
MGLDMYLVGRKYVKAWNHSNHEIKKLSRDLMEVIGEAPGPVTYIEVEAGYWRKANHIHAWFVKNVQDGQDDCSKSSYVSKKKLIELRGIIDLILGRKEGKSRLAAAKEFLPTQEGFFFGGTEYDEGYFQDLKDTQKILNHVLEDKWEAEGWEFRYHSSW